MIAVVLVKMKAWFQRQICRHLIVIVIILVVALHRNSGTALTAHADWNGIALLC